MKLKRSGATNRGFAPHADLGNKPHRGIGEYGKGRRTAGLMGVGAHVPQRVTSGNQDRAGYQASEARRMGRHTGSPPKADSRKRNGAEGLSKGSPPPGTKSQMGVRGSPDTHLGTTGRGGAGRLGAHDNHTGKSKGYPEDLSPAWFESLGAK